MESDTTMPNPPVDGGDNMGGNDTGGEQATPETPAQEGGNM